MGGREVKEMLDEHGLNDWVVTGCREKIEHSQV